MRLLLITEKLDKNDESTGFFHGQIMDLIGYCNSMIVMVLENRAHSLPESVKVISLGKERGVSRLGYIGNFYAGILGNIGNYDSVYVNREPQYIVLGGFIWKLFGKKIILYYNHRFSDWKLKVALFFVDEVVSPSAQGFPLKTKKLRVVPTASLQEHVCPVE
jgi:hypothetical protein